MSTEEDISVSLNIDSVKESVFSPSEPELASIDSSSTEETSSSSSVDIKQDVDTGPKTDGKDDDIKKDNEQEKDIEDDRNDSEKENKPAVPAVVLPPRPDNPRRWTWRCHKCHTHYALAVTNRCLSDGHYFCYGLAQGRKHRGRRQRQVKGESSLGAACKSSFDYAGWEAMTVWQRRARQQMGISPSPGCFQDCRYPGKCSQSRLDSIRGPSTLAGLSAGETDTQPPNVRPQPAPCPEDASRVYEIFDHLTLAPY
ncbi:hypothetical protein A7D00_1366 [Trichophyton violaceum]|uniref:Uncharacterized protein n=1 Tax=Trichophyton violaceum TaxID=34388 RepID=A0A178FLE9_TRIVO|nr:hypothetical protein A7D00_1366 [Trichophyton violaceum]